MYCQVVSAGPTEANSHTGGSTTITCQSPTIRHWNTNKRTQAKKAPLLSFRVPYQQQKLDYTLLLHLPPHLHVHCFVHIQVYRHPDLPPMSSLILNPGYSGDNFRPPDPSPTIHRHRLKTATDPRLLLENATVTVTNVRQREQHRHV